MATFRSFPSAPPHLLLSFFKAWTFCLIIQLVKADTYQTIASVDAYSQLRACVQGCFLYGNAGCAGDSIADALKCPYGCFNVALDSCYCRPDLQTDAERHLSTCIKTKCTGAGATTVDISSAVSIYDGYCIAAGYTALRESASTEATTTPSSNTNTVTTTRVVTETSRSTTTITTTTSSGQSQQTFSSGSQTSSPPSSSPSLGPSSSTTTSASEATNPTPSNPGDISNTRTDSDSGLSREGIIGLCVGIASIILALLTYLLMLKIRKEKKEKKRLEEQAAARPDLLTQPTQGQMQTHDHGGTQGGRDRGYTPYNTNPRQEEYNLLDL